MHIVVAYILYKSAKTIFVLFELPYPSLKLVGGGKSESVLYEYTLRNHIIGLFKYFETNPVSMENHTRENVQSCDYIFCTLYHASFLFFLVVF